MQTLHFYFLNTISDGCTTCFGPVWQFQQENRKSQAIRKPDRISSECNHRPADDDKQQWSHRASVASPSLNVGVWVSQFVKWGARHLVLSETLNTRCGHKAEGLSHTSVLPSILCRRSGLNPSVISGRRTAFWPGALSTTSIRATPTARISSCLPTRYRGAPPGPSGPGSHAGEKQQRLYEGKAAPTVTAHGTGNRYTRNVTCNSPLKSLNLHYKSTYNPQTSHVTRMPITPGHTVMIW